MQKHVDLVDLVKSFPTNIFLQNLASIQKSTSPVKFAHLAEKSGKGSISNLSTKASVAPRPARRATGHFRQIDLPSCLEVADTSRLPAMLGLTSSGARMSVFGKFSGNVRSFSAVSKRIFASKYAFDSIFQDLPDYLAEFILIGKLCRLCNICNILAEFSRNVLIFQIDFLLQF